jgi:molybdopterin molybdotransferase
VANLPATLSLIGESAAGAGFKGRVGPGQTVRIFTGAPLPDGADTIAIQEDVEETGETVLIKEAAPGRHIRPHGQDFQKNEVLMRKGTLLGARGLMLAASMNHAELPVVRRPKVAILATGDEVVPPGSVLEPDQIVSSVPYGLAALIERHGGEAIKLGIAEDNVESLVTLARAGAGADILVTIGGASVGARDLVGSALAGEGLTLDFAKIAMRPGKPMFSGRLGTQRLLGLPGNPVSAFICSRVFLVPMLERLLGVSAPGTPTPEAVLGETVEANGLRAHYMRAVSTWQEDGTRVVRPLTSQDSSLVAAFTRADCLILRQPHAPALESGAAVKIIPLAD